MGLITDAKQLWRGLKVFANGLESQDTVTAKKNLSVRGYISTDPHGRMPTTGTELGTPKALAWSVRAAAALASGDTTVTVSDVPEGTKAIDIYVRVTDATVNTLLNIDTFAGTTQFRVRALVANVPNDGWGRVLLDSSKRFNIAASAAFDDVLILGKAYYL